MMRRHPVIAATATTVAGCEGIQPVLDPRGPGAAQLADIWWLHFWLGTAVFAVVLGLLGWAVLRRRPRRSDHGAPDARPGLWIGVGGIAGPVLILAVLLGFTLHTMRRHVVAAERMDGQLTVEVVGHQWWWDIRYRYAGRMMTTANELHIPVGRPVLVRLESRDVIHSFWVPQLQGKMDLIPGRTNTTWIEAREPGVFRGQCAEFCGMQHARMAFLVVAQPEGEFEAWFEAQRQSAAPPGDSLTRRGEQVFRESACTVCHTVRGTGSAAGVGPDLTHVGGRRTLAAGTIPNTQGHLAGWISDPQGIKPGNHMPRVPLEAEELHAVVAYLQHLQ